MNDKMFKIAGVLSDLTRYSIYNYVCTNYESVSVLDVASEFSIHPNVARLHLTKLENVALIRSEFDKKNNKCGRPCKRYTVGIESVSFQLPHRDYTLLTTLAMNTLAAIGSKAWDAFIEQSYKYGKEFGEASRLQHQLTDDSSIKEFAHGIRNTLFTLGLNPHLELIDEEHLIFILRNCTFRASLKKYPEPLCKAHQKLLHGIFDAYFTHLKFKPIRTIHDSKDCTCCNYKIQLLPVDETIPLSEMISCSEKFPTKAIKEVQILKEIQASFHNKIN